MRNRRVGTFTMGLSLVAVGILSILSMFTDYVDILTVMKLSPLVLVLLGTEILAYSAINNEEKIKIDGFAIFIILILISATLVTTAGVVAAEQLNIESYISKIL